MESIYLLIPLALVFLAIAVVAYFWSVNDGQYDDLDSEASRILFDDKAAGPKAKPKKSAAKETMKAKNKGEPDA